MKKATLLKVLACGILLLPAALRADWTTYRGDQGRSGYYTGASALSVPLPFAVVPIATPGVNLSQPIKSGNTIYAGTGDGKIVEVTIGSNGASVSNIYQTGGPIVCTPLIYNNFVYFGSLDGYMYALNAADLSLAWKQQASGGVSASPLYITNGSVNSVVFSDNNGSVFSIQLNSSGAISNIVSMSLNDYISNSPALGDNIVFVSSTGYEYIINTACTTVNSQLLSSPISTNPVFTGTSSFVVSGLSGNIWNNNTNGTQTGSTTLPGEVFAPPAYNSTANVMRITSQDFGATTGKINLINAQLMPIASPVSIPQVSYGGAILTGSSVIVPIANGGINIFDRTTKSLAGTINIGANITGPISVDNFMVVNGNDGALHIYSMVVSTISATMTNTSTLTNTSTITTTYTITPTRTVTSSITATPTTTPNTATATGLWHQVPDNQAPSGYTATDPDAWYYGQDATLNYDTGDTANSGALVTQAFYIQPGQQLSFWSWAQTENGSGVQPPFDYDTRKLYISTDNGNTWTQIMELGGIEDAWENINMDLSAYAGDTVNFKFVFDTVDGLDNDYQGWYLDDIVVGIMPTATMTPPYTITPTYTVTPTCTITSTCTLTSTITPNTETATGLWHQVPDSQEPSGYTAIYPNTWYYGQDATLNYDTGDMANSGALITQSFYISPGQQLSFWSWAETENGSGVQPPFDYDTRKLYISINGNSWSQIMELGGTEDAWENIIIDMSAYAGDTVNFEFVFDTVDDVDNDYRGWYLNDIVIGAFTPTPTYTATLTDSPTITGTFTYSMTTTETPTITITVTPTITCTSLPAGTGIHWQEATNSAAFSGREGHAGVVFNGAMWVIGGFDGTEVLNDTYSSVDGMNWTQETASAAFSARAYHTAVVFNGKIWVIGGEDASHNDNKEIWSSPDGYNWTQQQSPPDNFSARDSQASLVYDNKIWVICGHGPTGDLEDVWSFDGTNWIEIDSSAPTGPIMDVSCTVFNDEMWVANGTMNGYVGTKFAGWSTDGLHWTCAGSCNPHYNTRFANTLLTFDGKMWMIAGYTYNEFFNDVWSSIDGAVWQQETASAEFPARMGHTSLVYNNSMWVIGGFDDDTEYNDVWFSPPETLLSPTVTSTMAVVISVTQTFTGTPTLTGTPTDTPTDSPSATETSTDTPTDSPTTTATDSPTDTLTLTPTESSTDTLTTSETPTPTWTPTSILTGTTSQTCTNTGTPTLIFMASFTSTPVVSVTACISLDTSFNGCGLATYNFSGNNNYPDASYALAVDNQGKIIIAGYGGYDQYGNSTGVLMRYS